LLIQRMTIRKAFNGSKYSLTRLLLTALVVVTPVRLGMW